MRSKVRALPVHQFLRAFPSAVAKRVLKSILCNMTGTSFLRRTFNWREAGVRSAHSIVSATFLHTADVELFHLATARDVSAAQNMLLQKRRLSAGMHVSEIPDGPWLCPDCLQDHVSAPPSRGTDADYVPSVTCTDATSASASSSNSSSSSDSSDGTSDSSDDSSSDSSNSSSSDSDDSSGSASD